MCDVNIMVGSHFVVKLCATLLSCVFGNMYNTGSTEYIKSGQIHPNLGLKPYLAKSQ